jgi:coenzyme PQQ precursor peptide PqqA
VFPQGIRSVDNTLLTQEGTMKWTKPRILEVAVGMEINAYACAEVK